jgi:hypothetical protein
MMRVRALSAFPSFMCSCRVPSSLWPAVVGRKGEPDCAGEPLIRELLGLEVDHSHQRSPNCLWVNTTPIEFPLRRWRTS